MAALLLLAVYVSLGRYYIGYVEQYQRALLQHFVEYTDLPLTVARLHGRWTQLSPIFTMEQLTLYGPAEGDDVVLTIENVSFQLDSIGSLLHGALQIKSLQIAGVHCSLAEVEPGRWQLKGYPAAENNSDFDNIIDLALSVESAELIDAQLHMSFYKGGTALLEVHELSLRHDHDFRRIRIQASFDQSQNPLIAIVEAQGDPRDREDFSARAYLKLDDIDFTAQLPAVKALGIDLQDARVDSEIWLDWQPDTVIAIQGAVSIPLLDIAALSGEALEPVKDLQFDFRAEKTVGNDWQGWLPIIQAQWRQQQIRFENIVLTLDADYAQFSMSSLSVDKTIQQLIDLELLNEKGVAIIQTLAPTGRLNNLHLNVSRHLFGQQTANAGQKQTPPRFVLQANLDNVGLAAWGGAPGASGVNGYLEVLPDGGLVELDTQQFSLDFPALYHHRLEFESGRGQVKWHIGKQRITVNSGALYLQTDHGPATGLLSLDLPANQDSGDPLMWLVMGIRDADTHYRNRYIPYILNQGFLDWMAASVPLGHIIDGGFIYRGSLAQDGVADRTVQLYFNVDNTTLDYHPDWPALTDISGLVLIDDDEVDVKASQAKLFRLEISRAQVKIRPLEQGGLWLTVDAVANGNASDALRIVNESAIRSIVGSVFENWQLDGITSAEVKLGIPLAGANADPDIDVSVNLEQSKLSIPDYRLQFENVNGPINYHSDSGITSKGIKATLYNKPVVVKVAQSDEGAIAVDIAGRLAIKDVADWSKRPALTFVSGETDFNARVFIAAKKQETDKTGGNKLESANSDGRNEFSVSSSLLGIAIDLPAPYDKTADTEHSFWLKLPLMENNPLLRMGLDDMAELHVRLDQGKLVSGLVIMDRSENLQHREGYLVVTGRSPYFDIDQWQPVLDRYVQETDRLAANGENGSTIEVSVRDLVLEQFRGFDQSFETSLVNIERRSAGWAISAENAVFEGELVLADDDSLPLNIKLDRLHLAEDAWVSVADDEVEGESKRGLAAFDPTGLNNLAADIAIVDLILGDDYYGNLEFKLRSDNNGLRLSHLKGNIKGISIGENQPATLEWLRTEQGDQSRFYGDFSFADIGGVLEAWQYERIIESEKGGGTLDLSWSGRPDEWQLKTSQGPITVKIKDGRFLKASDATSGTLKVVGIVNFANILRRLQLDFSDLYKSGISYDKIKGGLLLSKGDLIIVDDLTVKSPSSRFLITGRANMEQEQLDMKLIATLPVANNLPWIAALAGGLPVAAGVYVASKIFEDQVDRLSSAVYTIKGDWNNPELKFKRVFDDSKNSKSQSTKTEKIPKASKEKIAADLEPVP